MLKDGASKRRRREAERSHGDDGETRDHGPRLSRRRVF